MIKRTLQSRVRKTSLYAQQSPKQYQDKLVVGVREGEVSSLFKLKASVRAARGGFWVVKARVQLPRVTARLRG